MPASSGSSAADGWRAVERTLPSDWERQAEHFGFSSVAHPPPGAVCAPAAAKLRTMLHLVAANMSLRTTAAASSAVGLVSVSHVAIHKWFRTAVPFFSYLLLSLTGAQRIFATDDWAGYVVRAIDATTVQRPGAQGATARIHYCLRLNDMACVQCVLTDEKVGESLRNFTTSAGVLDIADRGYSNPPSIAAAVDQHGDVLVRWNPPSLPLYDRRGRKFNPSTVLRGLNLGEVREWPAEVRPKDHEPISARLVITRLPADKANEARARLRREQGKDATAQTLLWAGFIMLITTVPRQRLDCIAIAELYCLRWQIELQFKRDKSVGGLDLLPNRRQENIQAWILAKLLLAELARRIISSAPSKQPAAPSAADRRPARAVPAHVFVSDLWECAVLAWSLLRSAFLPIDWNHLQDFLRRFRAHLARLKRHDEPRQVAAFLALLREQRHSNAPG